MYRPDPFRETDAHKLVAFMRAHPFGTLVAAPEGRPIAAHIPIAIATDGETITLSGHVARANPIWQTFDGDEALIIFSGPHAYISPQAYEKRESVPTWNYIAVHAYGVPRAVHFSEAAESMNDMMARLMDSFESAYGEQWASLPSGFRTNLMQGIVGFEISVSRLEGQYKLSQNRSAQDQTNVAANLVQARDPATVAIGEAMQRNIDLAQQDR